MGNNASLSITVQPDDGSSGPVRAGSHVTGQAYIDVKSAVKAKGLVIAVRGEEKCRVHYTERVTTGTGDNRRTKTVHRYRNASRPFLTIQLPIPSQLDTTGVLNPGRYQFPFEFDIPANLPSSMAEVHGQGGWCKIEYVVRGELKGSGMFSNYHKERAFQVVSSPLDPAPVPFLMEPSTENVNYCCCFGRGTISFGVNVMDTQIGRGDVIPLQVACKNESTAKIRSVTVKVVQEIRWHAGGRSNMCTLTAFRSNISGQLSNESSLLHRTKSQLKTMAVTTGQRSIANQRSMLEDITNNRNVVRCSIPQNLFDTYQGQVLSCLHRLSIKVETGGCIGDLKIVVPLKIGTPPLGTPEAVRPDYETPAESEFDVYAAASAPAMAEEDEIVESSTEAGGSEAENEINVAASTIPVNWSSVAVASAIAMPVALPVVGGHVLESSVESPPVTSGTSPSYQLLLQEMTDSVNDTEIISRKTANPAWKPVFASISPAQFGALLNQVDLTHHQPQIAATIAPLVNDFKCDYCIAALESSAEWNRTNIVQKLLPFCEDLPIGQGRIKKELSSWELMMTERDFEVALKGKS